MPAPDSTYINVPVNSSSSTPTCPDQITGAKAIAANGGGVNGVLSPLLVDESGTAVEVRRSGEQLRLGAALILCVIFIVGESVGAYISNSLAIYTDVAHLCVDAIAFVISLVSISLSKKHRNSASNPNIPSESMSFGFHRAEILGALASIAIAWTMTVLLVFQAISRLAGWTPQPELYPKAMMITALGGLIVNILIGVVLHPKVPIAFGHSHGHDHGEHGHAHSHSPIPPSPTHAHAHHTHQRRNTTTLILETNERLEGGDPANTGINVRAAVSHVIGDIAQSIGVIIASGILLANPRWVWIDPVCTLMFGVISVTTTLAVGRDAIASLMESVPTGFSIPQIQADLQATCLEIIKSQHDVSVDAHDVHVWNVGSGPEGVVMSAHILVRSTRDVPVATRDALLSGCHSMLCSRYNVHHVALQLEYQSTVSPSLSSNTTSSNLHCNPSLCR